MDDTCLQCGQPRNRGAKFCSVSCSGKYQKGRRNYKKPYKVFTYNCLECGLEQTRPGEGRKFCNRRCAAIYNNRQHPKRGSRIPIADQPSMPCAHCGQALVTGDKYCSRTCSWEAQRARGVVVLWKEDPDSGTYKHGLKPQIRKHLIAEAGYKCQRCGWGEVNPVTGRSPLEVDHIDGDCYNNSPDNLVVLCPNCHSLTPTYRALNKGNSKRTYR